MANLQHIILLSLYLCSNQVLELVTASTPLCELCPCNSKPNEPPDIRCISTKIDNICDRRFWLEESNNSYPIQSLIFRKHNLKTLKAPFLQSALKLLDLSNNSIEELGNSIFSQLQSMSILILADNKIEQIDPEVFRGIYEKNEYFPLKSLKTLDLSNNKFHTLNDDTFEHIDELEVLILSNNPFKVIDAQTLTSIASLVYLRTLNLSYTQIKNLPTNFMHTPKYLSKLDLSGNYFEVIPETLGQSHSLETLSLDNNLFRNLSGQNVFPKILTLKELHMSYMPVLEKLDVNALSGLENLEILDLTNNKRLTYIHPDAMLVKSNSSQRDTLPLLKVFMGNNSISYLNNKTLNWQKLEQLDLHDNPWSCDCQNEEFVDHILPIYIQLDETEAKQLTCHHPGEMEGRTLYELFVKKSAVRCLDRHDFRPQENSFLLIGILSVILSVIGVCMVLIYIYRSKKLNLGPGSSHPRYVRV